MEREGPWPKVMLFVCLVTALRGTTLNVRKRSTEFILSCSWSTDKPSGILI